MTPITTLNSLYVLDRPAGEPIVDALVSLLRENPGLSAKAIAKKLDVRQRELSGAVNILVGMPLSTLLTKWHMLTALDLLRTTDLSLHDVALHCGYRQSKYLARAMDRQLKMTPFEYRNGYRRGVERPVRSHTKN